MKYILISVVFFNSLLSSGQNGLMKDSDRRILDKDTVRVIIQVADTLHYTNYTPQLNKANYFDKAGSVGWVIGFSVREKRNECDGVFDRMPPIRCNDYWVHLAYLDENKKPLSKSIIVWQSIQVK